MSPDDQIRKVLQWTMEARSDPGRLQSAIRSIERIVEFAGPSGLAMTSLATLHSMRAIALANAGACADALVEISMAIDHNNRDLQLQQVQRELTALMEAVREKAASMQYVADPRINPEDLVIVAEARRGFAPMKLYQSSRRAVRTREIARQCGA